MNCFPYTTHTLNCKELRQCFQIVIVTDNIRLMIKLSVRCRKVFHIFVNIDLESGQTRYLPCSTAMNNVDIKFLQLYVLWSQS